MGVLILPWKGAHLTGRYVLAYGNIPTAGKSAYPQHVADK